MSSCADVVLSCVNVAVYVSDLVQEHKLVRPLLSELGRVLFVPKTSTSVSWKKSFHASSSSLWNELPDLIRLAKCLRATNID